MVGRIAMWTQLYHNSYKAPLSLKRIIVNCKFYCAALTPLLTPAVG